MAARGEPSRGRQGGWPGPPPHYLLQTLGRPQRSPSYLSATWRPRPADQLEREMTGSVEGPQDGMEVTGEHHVLGAGAGALSTETEGWGTSWGHGGEGSHQGRGRRKPTEDSLGSSPPFHQLPCPRSFCCCPTLTLTPSPLLSCSLRKQRYVCWASPARHRRPPPPGFPARGSVKRKSLHPPAGRGS